MNTAVSGTAVLIGSIGLFLSLLFLFLRVLPMISIFEMRTLLPEAAVTEESDGIKTPIHGLLAEFEKPQGLLDAVHAEEGFAADGSEHAWVALRVRYRRMLARIAAFDLLSADPVFDAYSVTRIWN